MQNDLPNIQWFPGHMTKTLRLIERELKNVDAVIQLLDARIPRSSKNPELDNILTGKPCLLVLNKSDLAEAQATTDWLQFYRNAGFGALALSSKVKNNAERCIHVISEMIADRRTSRLGENRIMIVGIPNVGKSTFINNLTRQKSTRTEDRPGVTRGKQWITYGKTSLLDMPGVLWPKLANQNSAMLLAFTGAIKDTVIDTRSLSAALLALIGKQAPHCLKERYQLNAIPEDGYTLLQDIARKRGMLLPGGIQDLERASVMVLDELRAGKLGRFTFETPSVDNSYDP